MNKPTKLESLAIKLCENLPFDATFFEEEGFCKKPTKNCMYCKEQSKDKYLCNKKTYTMIPTAAG